MSLCVEPATAGLCSSQDAENQCKLPTFPFASLISFSCSSGFLLDCFPGRCINYREQGLLHHEKLANLCHSCEYESKPRPAAVLAGKRNRVDVARGNLFGIGTVTLVGQSAKHPESHNSQAFGLERDASIPIAGKKKMAT